MTTYLGKSCSFCLPRVPFVNCRQFMYLVISLLVLRAGYGIWLYQFRSLLIFLLCFSDVYSYIPFANTCICPKHMTDRQILLAKIFLFFSQPYGYFMDTIKSFCTEQNQTDYRYFDTGITVIFVMQNLLFWKWWIFPWFCRPSVSYGVFPIPVRK